MVVNKYSKEKYKHRDEPETYTEFTVVIQIDTGKKKTIVEIGSRRKMYDYRFDPLIMEIMQQML
ncbi:MAG: hypothetical protein ACOX3Q_12030 [Clostridia bacterium]